MIKCSKSRFAHDIFAIFIVAALVLSTILSAVVNLPSSQEGGEGKILICTADGFKYISIEDYNKNTPTNSSSPHCPFCTLTSADVYDFAPEIIIIELPQQIVSAVDYDYIHQKISSYGAITDFSPRAPPYSA